MRRGIFLMVALLLLTTVCKADTLYDTHALEQSLTPDVLERLDGLTPSDSSGELSAVEEILTGLGDDAGGFLRAAVAAAVVVLSAVMLCAILDGVGSGISSEAVNIGGVLAITVACTASLGTMLSVGQQTLLRIQHFSAALLPTMAAASVAVGAIHASSAIYGVTVVISNFLIVLTNKMLLPLVYAYVAASAANAAIGNDALAKIAGLIKGTVTNGLKFLLIGFTGFLSLTGAVTGSADAAAVKAAKLTLSGMVPVIGSIIGDASETVLVSAGILRGSVGVFGMIAILAICAAPFLQISIHYLTLKVTAALSGIVGSKPLSSLVEAISTAMSFILAMTGACALILLISCICSMKAVSA